MDKAKSPMLKSPRLGRGRLLAAALALCGFSISCSDAPLPAGRAKSPAESSGEVSLKWLAYRVESNAVESKVRGLPGDDTVRNSALALFEVTSNVRSIGLGRDVAALPTRRESRTAGTTFADKSQAERRAVQADALKLGEGGDRLVALEESRGIQRQVQGTDLQRKGETKVSQVTARGGEIHSTRTSGQVSTGKGAAREGVQKNLQLTSGRSVFQARTPQQVEALLQQRWSLYTARNAHFANLVRQDRLLKMFFRLSREELRQEIDQSTLPREEMRLVKSVSVGEIIPGETFTYDLLLENTSSATVRSVILYDEFPAGLRFENQYEGSKASRDGTEIKFSGQTQELISFLTPNEWEQGKIAWHLPGELGAGARMKLRFHATWYWEYGSPARSDAAIHRAPDVGSEVLGRAVEKDLILVAEKRAEGARFLKVSARQHGSGRRLEGYLSVEDFKPQAEMTDADLEALLRETVYFGAESGQPLPQGPWIPRDA